MIKCTPCLHGAELPVAPGVNRRSFPDALNVFMSWTEKESSISVQKGLMGSLLQAHVLDTILYLFFNQTKCI